jgi:hypothetical protein
MPKPSEGRRQEGRQSRPKFERAAAGDEIDHHLSRSSTSARRDPGCMPELIRAFFFFYFFIFFFILKIESHGNSRPGPTWTCVMERAC